jgi:hypothetical protein
VLSGAGAAGASAAGTATGQNVAHGHGQAGQQQTAGLPDHCIAKIRVSEPDDRRLNVLEWAPTGPEGEMIVAAYVYYLSSQPAIAANIYNTAS